MRWYHFTAIACSCLLLFISCGGNGTGTDDGNGVLQLDIIYGNSSTADVIKDRQITCKIIDLRSIIYSIAVSTGRVAPGITNDLSWKTIYTNSQETLLSRIAFPPTELSCGQYKSFMISMRNGVYWRCVTPAGDTVDLRDQNSQDSAFDALSPTNFFSDTGLCYIDQQNMFFLQTTNEKLGGFEISKNDTTVLTLRFNFNTLDWFDNDNSSTWTPGDSLDNWTGIPGTTTMMDFIVSRY